MNEITFNILKIVVSISAALISIYVIPLLREKLADSNFSTVRIYSTSSTLMCERNIMNARKQNMD